MIQESYTACSALLVNADDLQKESSSSGHTSKTSTDVGDAVSGTSVSGDGSRGGGIWADWAGGSAGAGIRADWAGGSAGAGIRADWAGVSAGAGIWADWAGVSAGAGSRS